MSERNDTDRFTDPAVSSAYDKLSDEVTPASLDQRILQLAKSEGSRRPLSSYLSLKPLAWAATLVLTVSLVINLQQDITTPGELVLEQQLEDDLGQQPDETRQIRLERESRQDRLEEVVTAEPAAESPATTPAPQSLAPAAAKSVVQQARELAVEQEVDEQSSLGFSASPVSDRRARDADQPTRHCTEAEMADASSWYRCILALEAEGKTEEAAAEKTRLFSAFPEFRVR